MATEIPQYIDVDFLIKKLKSHPLRKIPTPTTKVIINSKPQRRQIHRKQVEKKGLRAMVSQLEPFLLSEGLVGKDRVNIVTDTTLCSAHVDLEIVSLTEPEHKTLCTWVEDTDVVDDHFWVILHGAQPHDQGWLANTAIDWVIVPFQDNYHILKRPELSALLYNHLDISQTTNLIGEAVGKIYRRSTNHSEMKTLLSIPDILSDRDACGVHVVSFPMQKEQL